MSGKSEILSALRRASPPDPGLPDAPLHPQRWPNPAARLSEAVSLVGGTLVRVDGPAALATEVATLAKALDAKRVLSEVPAAAAGNVRLAELADPHELEGIDLAILPGAFAVAETGAVWLRGAGLRHRGVFVVTQHLALVVSAGDIVNDMHEAYARLRFPGADFGLFISGPSKTADIEQSLVIGAHGARSCTVFLVG
jgi:L-lactate dehydrogenase complex protein LldG